MYLALPVQCFNPVLQPGAMYEDTLFSLRRAGETGRGGRMLLMAFVAAWTSLRADGISREARFSPIPPDRGIISGRAEN